MHYPLELVLLLPLKYMEGAMIKETPSPNLGLRST
jgi:hypothetical protein